MSAARPVGTIGFSVPSSQCMVDIVLDLLTSPALGRLEEALLHFFLDLLRLLRWHRHLCCVECIEKRYVTGCFKLLVVQKLVY